MSSLQRFGLLVSTPALLILLAGCQAKPTASMSSGQEKFYTLRGRIVSTDPMHGELTLAHSKVPGYMEAMTMPYRLVNQSEMSEMHAGDLITARIVVQDGNPPKLDHLVVVGEARPDTLPPVQYHVPTAGDVVPDFTLLNQNGNLIRLSQFRGKVLLLTFIYTRCPVADFCPRMSTNFAEIDKALTADPFLYGGTHLLSVSFDPAYDTPSVLRSYGGAHTGRFTEENFRHWTFAVPSIKELPKMEQYFDVGVTGNDPATLTHSLSTVMIGRDGKILAWYPSNTWSPAELLERMKVAVTSKG